MRIRTEKDKYGEKEITVDAYYGINSLRCKENFQIIKRGINRQVIKAIVAIKKSYAKVNCELGLLDETIAKKIILSCDEILNGRLHGQFITDLIQGGAGSGINMNANEIIANRANEMLGGEKGTYDLVDPIKHVNLGQISNDVMNATARIATIRLVKKLISESKKLYNSVLEKSIEFSLILKKARTHLVLERTIHLGQEFNSFAGGLKRNIDRLSKVNAKLHTINLYNNLDLSDKSTIDLFRSKLTHHLSKFCSESFTLSSDSIDLTTYLDDFVEVSNTLKLLTMNASKFSNDLRYMAMTELKGGAEVNLQPLQYDPASLIDEDLPVIPEMVNQVYFMTVGMDATINAAVHASEFENNTNLPVIMYSLFDGITFIRRTMRTFREKCIETISTSMQRDILIDQTSTVDLKLFIPYLSIEKVSILSRYTVEYNVPVRVALVALNYLTPEQVEEIYENSLDDKEI